MRAIIQRVKEAKVEVDKKTVGKINEGFLVFLACRKDDTLKKIPILADKIANFRIFPDSNDKMNLSLKDTNGEILIVSQFTLYADTKKGRRPSFTELMEPKLANEMYESFIAEMKKRIPKVEAGVFQAKMKVHLINDGPLTFIIDV